VKRRARAHWVVGLLLTAIVAVGSLLIGSGASRHDSVSQSRAVTAHGRQGARVTTAPVGAPLSRSALVSEFLSTRSTQQSVRSLEDAPGAPACAPPPVPTATYPPGNSYGVPFLAAITGGTILTAYSEWVADHHVYKVGGKTYDLYPWDVNVSGITGWVSGLLELPSLSAQIPPQDIVFCDQGGTSCLGTDYPEGECISISELFPGPGTQGSEITNLHPENVQCLGYPGHQAGFPYPCVPYVISLAPGPKSSNLTVTGVEPDGALELQITTSAYTTVSLVTTTTQTCQQTEPTTIVLSTQAPTSLPAGAPIAPKPGNPDYRSLQTSPAPLTGPLATASSTAGSNNFAIPAWGVPPTPTCPDPGLQDSLNDPAGGYNTKNLGLYQDQTTPAGRPGWSQFSVTTTVVTLGFPVGPPPGFNF
jgi:hypothetical protein